MVEGGAPNALLRRGWNKNSLTEGTEILVEGFQAKDGANRANGRDITFPDGKKLFVGSSGIGRAGRETRQVRRRRFGFLKQRPTGHGLGVDVAVLRHRNPQCLQVSSAPLMPHDSTLEAVSAARWRIAISLTIAMMVVYFGFILLVAFNKPLLGTASRAGPEPGHAARRARHPRRLGADVDLHALGEHALRRARCERLRGSMTSALGEPNAIAIAFFLLFIVLSLGITVWAVARRRARPISSTRPAAASRRFRTGSRSPATT